MSRNAPLPTASPAVTAPSPGAPSCPVGVRIAGLPTTALDASRIPHSTELAMSVASLDQRLTVDAARLSDALYALIGTGPARPFKARLVGLRRAVHQGARIGALLDAAAPPDVLGAALTDRLHGHAALRRTRTELFAELGRVLPVEIRSAAAALGTLVQDPAFAAGLDYASPDLYEDLLRWSEHDTSGRRPLDGAAVRLAKYAGRAMAKPSPLTTFAASGFGDWVADAGVDVRLEGSVRAEVAEAGLLPLSRIAAALAHVPELGAAVRLRVNPSATPVSSPEGKQWLFTAPGPSGEVRALPATPALAAVLAAVHEGGTPARLRALLGAPGPGSTTTAADAVVARLVRLGLLEVRLGPPDQVLDAATLCDWLGRHLPEPHRGDRLTLLLDDLRAIRDRIDAARTAPPGAHRGIAATLRRHTTDAARRLGLLGPDEQLDRGPLYFHHTVITGRAAALDPAAWRPALADLALVPALLAPFDTLAPPREALRQRALTAYGQGFRRPFTHFLQDFGAWWAAPGSHAPTERDARRQDELRHLIAGTAPAHDGTVRLDPRTVRDLCGAWPGPDTSGDLHACYVQTLPDPATGLGLVLNTVTCGHGTGRTRIARLLDPPACPGAAAEEAPGDGPKGAPLRAEFDAVFGSALNQRAAATRYAIDLDGATSHRPPEQLIRPADLDVVHDRHTQRLHLAHRTTGRVVRPLHLGLLATPLLPLPARLLAEAFGQTSYAFWSDWPQLWRLLPPERTTPPLEGPGAAPGAGWTKTPRLALGALVLRRATWFIDHGRAPARAAGEPDAAYLVRVHTWRAALGLPQRCFLRALTPRPADGFAGPALHDKDRKPVYLDFAHAHLLRVFERVAATGRPLLLTEALPDLHDAPADRNGRHYATEFLIELPTAPLPAAGRRERTC
ncbi:lantibiotic dehydratase [Streptomyces sp. AM 4-1-1]|uniref:lantibiotic dehydratase n=1 Tax=Streptomyces sp. AM 4-1-1 TaxID=3028710 RepID=UPI0023B9743A|nr:lantibiotic dehydratase [Streptomyces sp. AM 4-1-1]WEH37019.1 lantibiotic dehydratase [Streptomyces sp. AM 4-1-1]